MSAVVTECNTQAKLTLRGEPDPTTTIRPLPAKELIATMKQDC